jgi:hypothetical protein
MSFRDDDEFDPATYAVGGGLPGMLWRASQQQKAANADPTPNDVKSGNNSDAGQQTVAQPGQRQPGVNPFSTRSGAAEFDPDSYVGSQGALLDWLRASQLQQSQYRPAPPYGIDFDVLARQIQGHESNNQPNAKNTRSSATGPGQFTDGAWNEIIKKHRPDIFAQYPPQVDRKPNPQLLALRSNPVLANDMTKFNAQDNADAFRKDELPVTSGNIYLAHFAGLSGAMKLLRADPSAAVESVLRPEAIDANPFLKTKTVGEVRAWADKQIADQARRMRAQQERASRRAFSAPQQPPPAFLDQPAPDFGVAPQEAPEPPVRRLARRTVGNQSWPLNPTPIASQASAGFADDGGGAPEQSMIGLFSGKPMRYWKAPIFDKRR